VLSSVLGLDVSSVCSEDPGGVKMSKIASEATVG
jgi:hypothetical protein